MALPTIAGLLMLCASLVVLLVGRDRGARREEARLDRIADDLAEQLAAAQIKAHHLQCRNAELRDELDAAITGAPSLTEAIYADLASLPITHPEDPR